MHNLLEGMREKLPWHNLKYYPNFCFDRIRAGIKTVVVPFAVIIGEVVHQFLQLPSSFNENISYV
jgi:hypothetical protein